MRVFRVENNFEDCDMAAHLVKSRPFIEGVKRFLQLLQQSCHVFRLHFREILQRGQYLLYTLYFGVAVLLHRLLESLLFFKRHLVELRLMRSIDVFQRKFKQKLPVDHHYYYYARMIEYYALYSIYILECSRIFKQIIGK